MRCAGLVLDESPAVVFVVSAATLCVYLYIYTCVCVYMYGKEKERRISLSVFLSFASWSPSWQRPAWKHLILKASLQVHFHPLSPTCSCPFPRVCLGN